MKYVMLIYQGTTPLPGSEESATLSEEEQKQIYADYEAINKTPGVTPGLPMGLPENATTVRVQGGKTLTTLEVSRLPEPVRRQLPTLCEGHFVERAHNILAFGLPGRGKTHLLRAIGQCTHDRIGSPRILDGAIGNLGRLSDVTADRIVRRSVFSRSGEAAASVRGLRAGSADGTTATPCPASRTILARSGQRG